MRDGSILDTPRHICLNGHWKRLTPEQMCLLIYQTSLVLTHDFLKIFKVKRKRFRDDKCINPTNLRLMYKAMNVRSVAYKHTKSLASLIALSI